MDIIIILLLIFLILAIILQDIFNPPTYTRFTLPLPQPPGQPPLPPFIYFDIDTRFTPTEASRIKTILASAVGQWNFHHTQKFINGVSSWAICTNMYSFNRLKPVWQFTPVPNGLTALNEAMDILTQRFIENGFGGLVGKVHYHIPTPITSSTIRAQTAFRRNNVPLSITVNPAQFDRADITNVALTGSMIHAWLHRLGYNHPPNAYTTYFSGEAPMCYMRGFGPKNPAVPDALYTQYFD
ncbi:hypothetical protein COL08_00745 [Priestia megaterium]|uniref:hypothetical protein n=1 Tax=Priestia megaterium TaxID=1404 RepID=UPI000BF531B9|nr:hypothetical protein [Priestia megaterium]PFW00282.1 hypothetical protein COL08_00745 [Priestia megaterium]